MVEQGEDAEARGAALALVGLDLELRRHHYHSPEEESGQVDLIDAGAIANLEWDDKDGLWAQFDEVIAFDMTPTRSSICIYADGSPVVTIWAVETPEGQRWQSDWETDLTHSERQRLLRRVAEMAGRSAAAVSDITAALLAASRDEDTEEASYTSSVVRDWLAGR